MTVRASFRRAVASLCVCAALLCGASAHAQVPRELLRRPITVVRVTGETSGATGARDVGVPVGVPLTRRLVRSTVQRLLESGRWADVQVDAIRDGDGVALEFFLRPQIVVTRVDVIDNTVLDDDEVRLALGLGPGGALGALELSQLADRVAATYAERGYVAALVRVRLRDTDDPTRKVLRVRITENEPLRIAGYDWVLQEPPTDLDLPGAIGIGEDDVFNRTQLSSGLREARRVVRAAGFYEARVRPPVLVEEGGEARLAMSVRFGPRYAVRILGHDPLERGAVEAVLALEESRLTPRTLEALDTRVTQLFQRHGFHDASIEVARIAGERPGTAVLEVRCTPGHQLAVVATSFPGASHYSSDYLHQQVVSVIEQDMPDTRLFAPVDSDAADRLGLGGRSVVPNARQSPAPLYVDPSRVFYAPAYDAAVEHLREIYEAAGFLAAEVGPVRLREVGRGRAVVVISVVEGPRTLLFGVTLQGNQVIGERELLETARLVRGEPFSYLGLEEAVSRMVEAYRERGHLYARVEPDVRFSDDRERAEVVLTMVERFEVRVGEISVEGAAQTDEGLIRDVLSFGEGDLWRPSLVRRSQDALMALGIFTSVNIAAADAELPERVKPVTVTVRERVPQYLDLSLGLSTGQGVRAAVEYGYRNLGGYGLGMTLRVQLGIQLLFQDDELERNISGLPIQDRLERRVTATLVQPHLPGLDNVRTTLDLVHLRDNQRSFGLDKWGAVLSLNWRPIQQLSLTFSGEGEFNGVQLFGDRTSFEEIIAESGGNPQIARLLRVPEGESFVISARVAGSLDFRDSPFVPTEGWFSSAAVEWARTLDLGVQEDGEASFFSHILKITATLNGYVSLGDVVLAAQVRAGGVLHLEDGSRTYPNRQFFLGGVDTLRGFNQDQLQPQDVAELQLALPPERRANTFIQGGDFFYLARVELRFPLFIDGLGLGVFADLGNHWANATAIDATTDCVASPARCFIRPTVGAGLRIATPVGPLALDLGFNLLQREDIREPLLAFHFSIGVF